MNLEKIQMVRMPFDKRNEDPKKNYGIGALQIWYVLKGPKGAVHFTFTAPVYLPHIDLGGPTKSYLEKWQGFDVGYHSPRPFFEWQSSRDCEWVEGGKCYSDGSALRAQDWIDEIIKIRGESPDEEIWRRLEAQYIETFGKEQK